VKGWLETRGPSPEERWKERKVSARDAKERDGNGSRGTRKSVVKHETWAGRPASCSCTGQRGEAIRIGREPTPIRDAKHADAGNVAAVLAPCCPGRGRGQAGAAVPARRMRLAGGGGASLLRHRHAGHGTTRLGCGREPAGTAALLLSPLPSPAIGAAQAVPRHRHRCSRQARPQEMLRGARPGWSEAWLHWHTRQRKLGPGTVHGISFRLPFRWRC
jgi:hypothetical protein